MATRFLPQFFHTLLILVLFSATVLPPLSGCAPQGPDFEPAAIDANALAQVQAQTGAACMLKFQLETSVESIRATLEDSHPDFKTGLVFSIHWTDLFGQPRHVYLIYGWNSVDNPGMLDDGLGGEFYVYADMSARADGTAGPILFSKVWGFGIGNTDGPQEGNVNPGGFDWAIHTPWIFNPFKNDACLSALHNQLESEPETEPTSPAIDPDPPFDGWMEGYLHNTTIEFESASPVVVDVFEPTTQAQEHQVAEALEFLLDQDADGFTYDSQNGLTLLDLTTDLASGENGGELPVECVALAAGPDELTDAEKITCFDVLLTTVLIQAGD